MLFCGQHLNQNFFELVPKLKPTCRATIEARRKTSECLWHSGSEIEFHKNMETTHNYIIKYLIFCMKSVFCDKINGTQFYRDH
ncbi:hypothetical protein F1631_07510 [Leptospira interrogans serovar Yeoncheon]|nr:hypothetical protein [Leptospira interrogans serovar Yeoncheon]